MRGEAQAARESRDQRAALATESARAVTYDANRWLWAVVAAAIAAVAYAYKRLSLAAAALGLLGFGCLFSLVLAGQHFPRLTALAPAPFVVLLAYAAYKYGVVRRALVACVRGVELANDENTKAAIRMQEGAGEIEVARAEMDAATVERDKCAHAARRAGI